MTSNTSFDPTTLQMLIEEARNRLSVKLKPTPLVYSYPLSKLIGTEVFLKLETQNLTGSFKIRPALNGILSQLDAARRLGVLTSSSGNFAQAVAAAGSELGVSTLIVMTSSTSPKKIEKTKRWGAAVEICGPTFKDRWETTFRLQKETGRLLLHPYDSIETLSGDGTVGLEILDQLESVGGHSQDPLLVFVPTSGGGLCAGVGAAICTKRPGSQIFAAQPLNNGSMLRSLEAGCPVEVAPFKTIADALVAQKPGRLGVQTLLHFGMKAIGLTETELQDAVNYLEENQRIFAEPGGAASVAALLKQRRENPSKLTRSVVCVISGAN